MNPKRNPLGDRMAATVVGRTGDGTGGDGVLVAVPDPSTLDTKRRRPAGTTRFTADLDDDLHEFLGMFTLRNRKRVGWAFRQVDVVRELLEELRFEPELQEKILEQLAGKGRARQQP